nr:hypothetical protein [uncultured Campylobacter sp.]
MQNLNEKYEIYQKRLAKKASRLTSLMNDAKWLKLCEILEASGCKGLTHKTAFKRRGDRARLRFWMFRRRVF